MPARTSSSSRPQPLAGELTAVNNRAVAAIEGIRENLRVLLVSGEPHAGERTWRNLLKSDAAVDLVHFTILRPPEKQDGTPINELSLIAFPTRELFSEKIDQFDLIIFDRYQHRGVLPILYFDNIARYVRDGGARARSPPVPTTPMTAASTTRRCRRSCPSRRPARSSRSRYFPRDHRCRQAPSGDARSRRIRASIPPHWGRWFRLIDVEKPQGEIVMKGAEDKPLLVLNRVGKGRVALLLSDHAWLWARGFEGGGPHVDLLRRLAHWLMKEPDLEEEALRATARAGELTVEQQTMADTATPAIVRSPSGKATRPRPEADRARACGAPACPPTRSASTASSRASARAFAHVGAANPREFIDARSTDALLKPLVRRDRRPHRPHGRRVRQSDPAAHRADPLRQRPLRLRLDRHPHDRGERPEGRRPRAALRRRPRRGGVPGAVRAALDAGAHLVSARGGSAAVTEAAVQRRPAHQRLSGEMPSFRSVRRDVLPAVGEPHPLARRRALGKRQPGTPFPDRPDRPRHEAAAAVRADIVEMLVDAIRAEGALVGADARQRRGRRQVAIAPFTVGTEL